MREDTALRFRLVAALWRMPYGNSVLLNADEAARAWPPTGDEDRSDYGVFHAMALASGGHRPEESLTTLQRLERDLEDGGFAKPELHPTGNSWLIRRNVSACPQCGGRGWFEVYPKTPLGPVGAADVSMTDTVTIERKTCDHAPLQRNGVRR